MLWMFGNFQTSLHAKKLLSVFFDASGLIHDCHYHVKARNVEGALKYVALKGV